MINHVDLSDWRRHRSRSFDFGSGLNFVLGPNGSGKTSVLTGMRFGLFGLGASKHSIRVGARRASCEVTLEGSPGIVVGHAIDRSGRIESSLRTQAGAPSGPLDEIVADRFGADSHFLNALVFLAEGDIYRYEDASEVDLQRQIHSILPVEGLLGLRNDAEALRSTLSKRLKVQRSELRLSRDEVAALVRDEERLAIELNEVTQRLEEARARLRKRQGELRQVEQVKQGKRAREAWNAEWTAFAAFVDASVSPQTPGQLLEALQGRLRDKQGQLGAARQSLGHASGRLESVSVFMSALREGSEEACPLCRQALDEEHRERALASQASESDRIHETISTVQADIVSIEQSLTTIDEQIDNCQDLIGRRPGDLPTEPPLPSPAVLEDNGDLEQEVATLQSSFGARSEQLGEVRERLRAGRAAQSLADDVTAAFRTDALLTVVSEAGREFLADVVASVLEPIADELKRQWKSYRSDAELTLALGGDGRLALTDGDTLLPFSSLSGGEKMVSLILFRIALVKALTKADFIVLDEPLEHLDPRSRRLLLSSIYQLVSRGTLPQVIMSTYEETLVRRLILRSQAQAIYVGRGGLDEPATATDSDP